MDDGAIDRSFLPGSHTELLGIVTGIVAGADDEGRPMIRWGDSLARPRPAASVWMDPRPDWLACIGVRVVVGFQDGDRDRPVILGLIDPPARRETTRTVGDVAADGEKPDVVRIESGKVLVIQCGKAKIALRADGQVTIVADTIQSHARMLNRVKGAAVQIN